MAKILLQNGPHDIKTYVDVLKAVERTIHFKEIKQLFGLLFHYSHDFYSPIAEAVNSELFRISERLAQGEDLSDYELMKLYHMHNSMRSGQAADAYVYYKKSMGLESLFEKAAEFGAKNNPHKIMVEEAEKVLAKELPQLGEILAGKEGTVLEDAQKLWQAKANIWLQHRIPGLKSVYTNLPSQEQLDLTGDRVKLANAITSDMPEFNDKKDLITYLTTGKIIGYSPKNQKERIFYNKYLETRDKCLRETTGFSEEFNKLINEIIYNEEIVEKQAKELHEQVVTMLKEKSPVSYDEAMEWANKNVYISRKVASSLKNIDYPEEELKKDIAEYYQLCGGKLGPVEITGSARNKRAYARGKYQIDIDNDFNKRTLFHECSHLVENYASLELDSSKKFIEDRASGEPERLNKIIPNSAYGNNEKAYPDSFINPYVGKIYTNGSEVMSMGMQMLADPETLLYFLSKDPEHFKLTISQCLDHNDILKELLKQENEKASLIMAQQNNNVDLKSAWEKSLKDAMPKNFKEALLLPDGVDGCRLNMQKKSQGGYLYIYDSTGAQIYGTLGKSPQLLALAYLYLASKNSLLTESVYGSGDTVEIGKIQQDLFYANNPPAWFDVKAGLPKYTLPPDVQAALSNKNENKKLYKIFINSLDRCLTDSVMDALLNDWFEGYSFQKKWGTYDIYSRHLQKLGNSGFVGEFTKEKGLRLATLLILNKREQLPESIYDEKQAIRTYRKFVETETIPSWFNENIILPEIK